MRLSPESARAAVRVAIRIVCADVESLSGEGVRAAVLRNKSVLDDLHRRLSPMSPTEVGEAFRGSIELDRRTVRDGKAKAWPVSLAVVTMHEGLYKLILGAKRSRPPADTPAYRALAESLRKKFGPVIGSEPVALELANEDVKIRVVLHPLSLLTPDPKMVAEADDGGVEDPFSLALSALQELRASGRIEKFNLVNRTHLLTDQDQEAHDRLREAERARGAADEARLRYLDRGDPILYKDGRFAGFSARYQVVALPEPGPADEVEE